MHVFCKFDVNTLSSAVCPSTQEGDFNRNLLWIIPVAVIVGLLILGGIILAIVLLIVCITVRRNSVFLYKNLMFGSIEIWSLPYLSACMYALVTVSNLLFVGSSGVPALQERPGGC